MGEVMMNRLAMQMLYRARWDVGLYTGWAGYILPVILVGLL